jgi:hypothetical protein
MSPNELRRNVRQLEQEYLDLLMVGGIAAYIGDLVEPHKFSTGGTGGGGEPVTDTIADNTADPACGPRVVFTHNYGPFEADVEVRIVGFVDDDISINGSVLQAGQFPFVDSESFPCSGSGFLNGAHAVSTTFNVSQGNTVEIAILQNFRGSCNFNGTVTFTPSE